MALFTKATKTRVSALKGGLHINKFSTPKGATPGNSKAITITLRGEDMKTYSITVYGAELEYLKHMVNTAKFEEKTTVTTLDLA